jgi:hypothetical protein
LDKIDKLGLAAEDLIDSSIAEYHALSSELVTDAFEENLSTPEYLHAAKVVASQEAMIRVVASMIERNNQALLSQLKQLGVVPAK